MLQGHAHSEVGIAAPTDPRHDLLRTSHFALAGELVGAVVHDLRQPVTAMTVNVEVAIQLLHRRPSDVQGAVAALEDALDGGRQLGTSLRVVHNLVAHRKPMRAAVALEQLVTESIRLVQTEANSRHVHIEPRVASGLPVLHADPAMLRQAVLSILLDAVENARPTGTVQVHVAATGTSAVDLAIRHLRRDDSPDEDWELAVARWVCEAHGVTLQIEREPDGYVTFRTQWPVGEVPFDIHVMQ